MRISLAIAMAVAMLLAAAGCGQQASNAEPATASPPAAVSAAQNTAPLPVAAQVQAGAAKAATPAMGTPAAEPVAADDHAPVNTAIDQTLGDHAKYEQVILAFQSAVVARDAPGVAALVDYPFAADIDGKTVKIADASAFIARYGAIVTPAIADVVARQKYADLFVNYKGVMFGNGEAWINGLCRDEGCKEFDVRVVAIQPTGQ